MGNGRSIIRCEGVPKPFEIVDTREMQPLPLFANHPNWIGGERRQAMKTGDYTVEEMERVPCLERKSLADIVACTVTYREHYWRLVLGSPGSNGRPS